MHKHHNRDHGYHHDHHDHSHKCGQCGQKTNNVGTLDKKENIEQPTCENKKCKCCNSSSSDTDDLESHSHHHHHKDGTWNKFLIFMGWRVGHHHHNHSHAGHDHTHTFEPKKWILIIATILGLIAIYHMLIGLFFNGPIIQILDNDIVQLTFGSIAFFIMGISFLIGSWITIKNKEIAEDTLVALATTSAFIYSISVFIVNHITGTMLPYFFYEQIEVLWLIYLGRFIEEWLTNKVSKEISSLESLKPKHATVIREGKELHIHAKDILIGDIVVVKPGQLIPVDGKVIEGNTTIDESSLTGESLPINKEVGSTVFGGTVSSDGLIKLEATKLLNDSFISQIINSVNESLTTKPKSQRIADKIAAWLIPSVLVISFMSFILTGIIFSTALTVPHAFSSMAHTTNAWIYAYYILITVLVIACPCSFAMTTPMAVLAASTTSKREGAIFSSNKLFETIKSVDVICFDKTGTLTEGKFEVINYTFDKKFIEEVVSIEKASNHPLALSIVNYFNEVNTKDIKVEEVIGKGVKSSSLMVGSLFWVNEVNSTYIESEEITSKRKEGSVIIYVFNNNEVLGYIELRDKIKETTLASLSQIRKMGIKVAMITGDHKDTALSIASQLGISSNDVYAEVNPQDKSNIIREIQSKGKVVSFVGDGINDSVALVQSDIGIAMGEGSDAAIEAADIVLKENDLLLVSYSIWLSRKTLFAIKRGFGIAIIYNALMVPMAALGIIGLTGAGPAIAALSMVFNDSIAMINAMTLTGETKNKFIKKLK